MKPITYLVGDATHPQGEGPKIIAHVCNNAGGWGSGFVVAISKRWAKPESSYRAFFSRGVEAGFTLGAVDLVAIDGTLSVANMIAQHGYRGYDGKPAIRYDALEECLGLVAKAANTMNASVHMPRIGCGLAGGSWDEVEKIITRTLCEEDVPVFVYDLPKKTDAVIDTTE